MTTTADAVAVARQERRVNGDLRYVVSVSYDGHVVEAVTLDMADQWDFMELAGSQLDNHAWVNTALLATSVISFDGVPQPAGVKSRDQIRAILRKLGERGVDVLQQALDAAPEPKGDRAADKAAAGN